MESKELEEMRAQLTTLNEKLEDEGIVDEKHFSEATKNHLSKLQRKLIGRIVLFILWAAFFYWKLELGIFLFSSIGLLITSIYLYWVVCSNDSSMPIKEYSQRLCKALKIYKKANKWIWILTMLLILAWGTYVLILNWPSNLVAAFSIFFAYFFIAFFIGISYYISNVCVSPDVELMLEEVLEDLNN